MYPSVSYHLPDDRMISIPSMEGELSLVYQLREDSESWHTWSFVQLQVAEAPSMLSTEGASNSSLRPLDEFLERVQDYPTVRC